MVLCKMQAVKSLVKGFPANWDWCLIEGGKAWGWETGSNPYSCNQCLQDFSTRGCVQASAHNIQRWIFSIVPPAWACGNGFLQFKEALWGVYAWGNILICFQAVAWWFQFLFYEKYFIIIHFSPFPCHSQRYTYSYYSLLLHIEYSFYPMKASSHLTALGKPFTIVNPQNSVLPREGPLYISCEMGTSFYYTWF